MVVDEAFDSGLYLGLCSTWRETCERWLGKHHSQIVLKVIRSAEDCSLLVEDIAGRSDLVAAQTRS